jgi:ketosteroid isomerase-like protein
VSDIYAINVAKTEFREGYKTGNVDRILAVFDQGGFSDMSEGEPSKYGLAAVSALRARLAKLFVGYSVEMTPIIINIVVNASSAHDYGWHEFILTPKSGGTPIHKRQRYFELWRKDGDGNWKIQMFFTNSDVKEELNGFSSHWFLSEEKNEQASA